MRKKKKTIEESGGIADGLIFDHERIEKELNDTTDVLQTSESVNINSPLSPIKPHDTVYKKYYKPHPKKGKRGGDLGRPIVNASMRKVQFSITCTPTDKIRYQDAAKKDRRKFPDFIKNALDEYIERHHLE